jgi:hypothetical protein
MIVALFIKWGERLFRGGKREVQKEAELTMAH